MQSSTREHFEKLLQALKIEKQEELDQYKLFAEGANYTERIENGITLYPIEFIEIKYNEFGDQLIEVKSNPNQEGASFKTGKTIDIFNSEGESCIGQITYFRENRMTIKVNDEDIDDWIKKGKVGLNVLVDTKTYDAYEQCLTNLLSNENKSLASEFYDSTRNYSSESSFKSKSLNNSQNQAVNEVLSESPISIIHGPPGTGKTTTLVAAINKLVSLKKSILVCTPSNAAVDNVARKLIQDGVNVVRVGNESKVDESVMPAYLESKIRMDSSYKLLQQLKNQSDDIRKKAFKFKRNFGKDEYAERKRLKQELKTLKTDIRTIQKDLIKTILEKAEVICGTFYSIRQFNLPREKYDFLFIDEAGQAVEPAIWSVSHLGDKMILAGDDLQLPPTIKSRKADKLGLSKSVLERATEINYPKSLLNVQYRMNAKIMAFSNSYFYENKLEADTQVADWTLENDPHSPVEFIDTAGCGYEEKKEENGGGISNLGEVDVIEKRFAEFQLSNIIMDAHQNGHVSLGIITPYRSQLSEIQSRIEKTDNNTVDSFQGQEKDIIIISLVRSNENGDIGFLTDYRRMNVAMTRAKKKLVVIGDSATIGQDQFYAQFLDYVEKEGSYRTAWEYL